MSVYIVVAKIPTSTLYATVAATPQEAEKNVAEELDGKHTRKDVKAQANIEGLQMFARDAENQTTEFDLD